MDFKLLERIAETALKNGDTPYISREERAKKAEALKSTSSKGGPHSSERPDDKGDTVIGSNLNSNVYLFPDGKSQRPRNQNLWTMKEGYVGKTKEHDGKSHDDRKDKISADREQMMAAMLFKGVQEEEVCGGKNIKSGGKSGELVGEKNRTCEYGDITSSVGENAKLTLANRPDHHSSDSFPPTASMKYSTTTTTSKPLSTSTPNSISPLKSTPPRGGFSYPPPFPSQIPPPVNAIDNDDDYDDDAGLSTSGHFEEVEVIGEDYLKLKKDLIRDLGNDDREIERNLSEDSLDES